MMNLILHRTDLRQDCTLGVLELIPHQEFASKQGSQGEQLPLDNGTQFQCATLEPKMSSSLSRSSQEKERLNIFPREEKGGSSTLEPPVVTNQSPSLSRSSQEKERLNIFPREEKGGSSGSAIPPGRYRLTWRWSTHFARQMPFLENVPGFTGIMIHPGNTARDTKGCILVGQPSLRGRAEVGLSRKTFATLEALLHSATDPIWLTISN